MSEVLPKGERKNEYVGQRLNQLRDGFGIYCYANKFFRYEGEWSKGKKHGFGKLVMGDGSFYEGEFKFGEIEGKGRRIWKNNGNSYSGEFSRGEMHGEGEMTYKDGSKYTGTFVWNVRHGQGVYEDAKGNTYEGAWYQNKKHGRGTQTYSNHDQYVGDWVEGKRHGSGELACSDGSLYDGQWRNDLYNGQGTLSHSSGVVYDGVWLNGRPLVEANAISIEMSRKKYHEVNQGRRFEISAQIIDKEGNPVEGECGREFQIRAGYRCMEAKDDSNSGRRSSFLELIEVMETKPVMTPFGYEILPYPLVETMKDIEEGEEDAQRVETIPENSTSPATSSADKLSDQEEKQATTDSSSPEGTRAAESELVEEISARFNPPPAPQRSSNAGNFLFKDLFLLGPPANFRPFNLDMDLPDAKVKRNKDSRNTSAASSGSTGSGVDNKQSKQMLNQAKPVQDLKNTAGRRQSLKGGQPSRKSAKDNKLKSAKDSKGNRKVTDDNDNQETPSDYRMRVFRKEICARLGEYVFSIEEITEPPFLGKKLPPAFFLVKVVPKTRTIKKSSKR